MARNLTHTTHNGVNIFNKFEMVSETFQKILSKEQYYLKSFLFHYLISCKDWKWCSCVTPNTLFFLQGIKKMKRFFYLPEVYEAALYSAFWERFPGINQSWSHAMWHFHPVLDYLRAQQVIKSIFPAQQKLFPLSSLRERGSTSAEVSCCSWKNWWFSVSPQGLCVLGLSPT